MISWLVPSRQVGKSIEMTKIIAGNRNWPQGKRIPRVPSLTWHLIQRFLSAWLLLGCVRESVRSPRLVPIRPYVISLVLGLLFSRLVSSFVVPNTFCTQFLQAAAKLGSSFNEPCGYFVKLKVNINLNWICFKFENISGLFQVKIFWGRSLPGCVSMLTRMQFVPLVEWPCAQRCGGCFLGGSVCFCRRPVVAAAQSPAGWASEQSLVDSGALCVHQTAAGSTSAFLPHRNERQKSRHDRTRVRVEAGRHQRSRFRTRNQRLRRLHLRPTFAAQSRILRDFNGRHHGHRSVDNLFPSICPL